MCDYFVDYLKINIFALFPTGIDVFIAIWWINCKIVTMHLLFACCIILTALFFNEQIFATIIFRCDILLLLCPLGLELFLVGSAWYLQSYYLFCFIVCYFELLLQWRTVMLPLCLWLCCGWDLSNMK